MTRLQTRSYRIFLPSSSRSQGVVGCGSARGRIAWFIATLVGMVIVPLLVMEAANLRFCHSFHDEHMNKVFFFQRNVDHPTVVYLGSSQVDNAVMPAVVQEEAARRGLDLGQGFNLGIGSAGLEVAWILARDTLKDDHRPRVLVVGVTPILLAAETQELQRNRAGYGSLMDVTGHVCCRELPASCLPGALVRGCDNLMRYPFRSHGEPQTGSYRSVHLQQSQGGRWLPGDAIRPRVAPRSLWRRELDRLQGTGFKQLTFQDDSRHARLLKCFKRLANEREMQLVLVYPPQHQDFNDRMLPPGTDEAYQTWITEFCEREGIRYHDLTEPSRYEQLDFGDPVHLNARGAEKFSRRLAEVIAKSYSNQ